MLHFVQKLQSFVPRSDVTSKYGFKIIESRRKQQSQFQSVIAMLSLWTTEAIQALLIGFTQAASYLAVTSPHDYCSDKYEIDAVTIYYIMSVIAMLSLWTTEAIQALIIGFTQIASYFSKNINYLFTQTASYFSKNINYWFAQTASFVAVT